MIGFDYTDRIAPAALAAAGCSAAFRYFTRPEWPKSITRAEAVELLAARIPIVVNFESTADRMRGAGPAGHADALEVLARLAALGAPDGLKVWFSADWDVSAAEVPLVLDYLHAAADVLGSKSRVGLYAGYRAAAAAADAGFGIWQTIAWSGGHWDTRAVARQTGEQRNVGGMTVDVNQIINPSALGAWTTGGTVSLDNKDVMAVWSYSHGDAPDVHQTLGNAAGWAGQASSKADQINAKLDALLARPVAPPAPSVVVDVAALAAALSPLLHAGATADECANAVVQHLGAKLASGAP